MKWFQEDHVSIENKLLFTKHLKLLHNFKYQIYTYKDLRYSISKTNNYASTRTRKIENLLSVLLSFASESFAQPNRSPSCARYVCTGSKVNSIKLESHIGSVTQVENLVIMLRLHANLQVGLDIY